MTGEFSFACFKVDQTNFVPVLPYHTQLQISTKIPSNLSVVILQWHVIHMLATLSNCMGQLVITSPQYNKSHIYLFSRLLGQSKRERIIPHIVSSTSTKFFHTSPIRSHYDR